MYTHLLYKLNFFNFTNFVNFLASSVNAFCGITSLIVNFWTFDFKTSKSSTCFFLVFRLFLLVFQMLYRVEKM